MVIADGRCPFTTGGQCREPQPVGRLVADPADLAAQHRVLVPEHQELGIPGRLTPGQHHHAAEQAAREQVHDREDHSAMIPAHKTGQARSSNRALQGDAGQPQAPQRVAVARQLGALQDTGPQVQHPAVAGWSRLASQTGPDRA